MNKFSEQFKNALNQFLRDCEDQIGKYAIPEEIYRSKPIFRIEGSATISSFTTFIDYEMWSRSSEIAVLKKLESAEQCVEIIRSKFKLRSLTNHNKKLEGKELIEANKNWDREQLLALYLMYKNLKDRCNITLENFVEIELAKITNHEQYYNCRALLIGCHLDNDCSNSTVKISDFELRRLSDKEKVEMMNNVNSDIINGYDKMTISTGFIDQMPFSTWIEWKGLESVNQSYREDLMRSTQLNIHKQKNFISKFLLSCRLSLRLKCGIRNIYFRSYFIEGYAHTSKWNEYIYGFGDFGKNRYSYERKKINRTDLITIQKSLDLISIYENLKVDQVDKALEHYSNSYERNLEVYSFTELIMAIEAILNKEVKINKEDEKRYIQQIVDCESKTQAKRIFNSHPSKFTIKKILKKAVLLLEEKHDTQEVMEFLEKCFASRNKLLHGNINFNSFEIGQCLPKLRIIVGDLLLKILQLITNKDIECGKNDYFDRLDEFICTKLQRNC